MIVFYNDYVNKAIGINQLLVLFEALAQDAKAGEMKISELFNSSKIIWIYSIFLYRIQLFAQLLGLEEYGTDLLLEFHHTVLCGADAFLPEFITHPASN